MASQDNRQEPVHTFIVAHDLAVSRSARHGQLGSAERGTTGAITGHDGLERPNVRTFQVDYGYGCALFHCVPHSDVTADLTENVSDGGKQKFYS